MEPKWTATALVRPLRAPVLAMALASLFAFPAAAASLYGNLFGGDAEDCDACVLLYEDPTGNGANNAGITSFSRNRVPDPDNPGGFKPGDGAVGDPNSAFITGGVNMDARVDRDHILTPEIDFIEVRGFVDAGSRDFWFFERGVSELPNYPTDDGVDRSHWRNFSPLVYHLLPGIRGWESAKGLDFQHRTTVNTAPGAGGEIHPWNTLPLYFRLLGHDQGSDDGARIYEERFNACRGAGNTEEECATIHRFDHGELPNLGICSDCWFRLAGLDPTNEEWTPDWIVDRSVISELIGFNGFLIDNTEGSRRWEYAFRISGYRSLESALAQVPQPPLPPAVWALGAALGLFGWIGHRRRSRQALAASAPAE